MAQIIKGVSPEREAYLKGQQERGITVRGGVSPQRERYLRDAQKPIESEVIEAKPVNQNRTAMQQRPINSSLGRIGANPVDINTARNVAADMVNNGNYKHPELKPKLQAMFPKPKLALGGIVKANQALYNQQYRQPTSAPFPGFDNMTTDMPTGALQDVEQVMPKRMSIGNALALQDSRDNSFDNMTTDGYKKGGVVKPKLGAMGKTIKGPGTGTSDSIDADLPVGSAIIPASVLKLYGEDFFDKLEAIAESSQPNEEAIEGEYIPANKPTKPTLGMKCGGIAKMKDGGIADFAPGAFEKQLVSNANKKIFPKMGATELDVINDARGVANSMANRHDYQHPEYRAKLKHMFPKSSTSMFKDGGIVEAIPAKVSNGERYLTPEAVKFFGQKFVNTLIHASPNDVKEEMGEVKDGKIHAKQGYDPNAQARINKMTGVDRTPVNVRPMSKAAVDMTATEQLRTNIKGNPPSNVKFGQGPFDPNLVYDERAQTLSEPRNALNKANRANAAITPSFNGGTKQALGMAGKALGVGLLPNAIDAMTGGTLEDLAVINENNDIYNKQDNRLAGVKAVIGNEYNKFTNRNREIASNVGNIVDKGKRFVNTNYPNAVSDIKSLAQSNSISNTLGVNRPANGVVPTNKSPSAQVKNAALLTASNQPVAKMPFISLPIGENAQPPKLGVSPQPTPMANATPEVPTNSPIGVTQSQQPYSTRLGNMGDNVNTLDVTNRQGGTGRVQFADGRSLMPEQTDYLKGELARNADPAFQARLAEQAKIVNDRMGWAKQNDLERNARLGNKAAADTLKAQSDTQQAQLVAQANADTIGYNREKDKATLAQNKELKQMELNQPKPITTNTYSPEGTLTGQDVGVVQYDKEGNPVLKKLSQNTEDKDIELLKSLPPEKITDKYNNAVKFVKELQPNDPRYMASINFLRLHNQLFPSTPVQ